MSQEQNLSSQNISSSSAPQPNSNLQPSTPMPNGSGQPETRAPRYHINHSDTGGMPVGLWGMDRRDVWRTCLCFHCRQVTIFIGVWYLIMYIVIISFHIAPLVSSTPGADDYPGVEAIREDPILNNTNAEPKRIEIQQRLISNDTDNNNPASRRDAGQNGTLTLVLNTKRKPITQIILLEVCNILITFLLLYGAVRGKPSYLMPFFVVRYVDFCIFLLAVVGYFSYVPTVTESILNYHGLHFPALFVRITPQLRIFIAIIITTGIIATKMYTINVIWNCYKYMMLRNTVIRGVISYTHDHHSNIMGIQQNLLPVLPDHGNVNNDQRHVRMPVTELPDYDTATKDPRYVKLPVTELPDYDTATKDPRYVKLPPLDFATAGHSHKMPISATKGAVVTMPPPPPYNVAISSERMHLFDSITQQQGHDNNSYVNVTRNTIQ